MKTKTKDSRKIIQYWPLAAGLILVLIGLVIFLSLGSGDKREVTQDFTTSTISTGDIRISAFGSGTLIAAEELQIGFETGGIVKQILVETGDMVQEGDVLAVLYDEDLQDDLTEATASVREMTSDASAAEVALELAEAKKDVLTAQETLSFYLSPYVYKSEVRLQEAKENLRLAISDSESNPSEQADERVAEAQAAVDHAELSLEMNYETYYEEYVPDFFNFRWRDEYGYWHDYYDPPSELEVSGVWAELAEAEARVAEAEFYLAALTEGEIPAGAYGSDITALEKAVDRAAEVMDELEGASLIASMDGMIIEISLTEQENVGTKKMVTIARMDPPTLEASFDEGDWTLVQEGNPVEVIFDALPEKTYQGVITFVDPTLQSSGGMNSSITYVSALVELDVIESGWAGLPLSSAASVEVIAGEAEDAVLLPIDGLQESSGSLGTVLVESEDGFLSRDIELGLWDVLFVEVVNGLHAGDVVLIGELE